MAKRHGKSPISWPGGKYRLAPSIIDLMPPHEIYVETCGGAGSLLFCKEPAGNEVYNDVDHGLTNFFAVTREEASCAILLKRLALTPYSREECETCVQTWKQQADPIEQARRWFVAVRMSFRSMIGRGWACSNKPATGSMPAIVSAWHNAQTLVNHAQARLASVQIENRDLLRILDIYDTPGTLFYIDPPYDPDTWCGGVYEHEMSRGDHQRLVARILSLRGKAVISGYQTDLYKPLEQAGYERVTFAHACTIGRAGNGQAKRAKAATERTECIWHKPVGKTRRRPSVQAWAADDVHLLQAV